MNEFGIFNEEGCIERGFFSRAEAETARSARYSDGEHVAECCHDHPEEEAEACPECNAEELGE